VNSAIAELSDETLHPHFYFSITSLPPRYRTVGSCHSTLPSASTLAAGGHPTICNAN
jgi:hypothetical protein